jgi:hypothetical protein
VGYERTGVTHLVHAWHMQGNPVGPFEIFDNLSELSCELARAYDALSRHVGPWQYDSISRLLRA